MPYTWPRRTAKSSTPQLADPLNLRIGQRPHQPQQGAAAGRQPELGRESRAGAAGKSHADRFQHAPRHQRSPTASAGQALDLLGERASDTVGGIAEESADPNTQARRPAQDLGITQRPLVAAVDTRRFAAASRAARRGRARGRPNTPAATDWLDQLDHNLGQVRQSFQTTTISTVA